MNILMRIGNDLTVRNLKRVLTYKLKVLEGGVNEF